MKALILCGGKGTRMAPLSNNLPKQLIPIANKPIIVYIIDELIEANINQVGIVVSPENINIFMNTIGDGKIFGIEIHYIVQQKPLGLAHAIKEAKDFLKDDNFIVLLGDNLLQHSLVNVIDKYNGKNNDAYILLREVDNPTAFGIAELNDSGEIIELVEKPKNPKSNLAILGQYILSPVIFEAIDDILPSWRGEYEITDAIQKLLESGSTINYDIHEGIWQDIGNPEDLLIANRRALEHYMVAQLESKIDRTANIKGKVNIGKNVIIKSSSVVGPVVIGDNCRIIDSKIYSFISIGANSVVKNSSATNSIILNDCVIEDIDDLTDSIIGRKSHIFKGAEGKQTRKLIVGDESTVALA